MTKENHASIWRFANSDIACLALGIILGALAAFAPINARAADLPSAKVAPAPLFIPATSWTGLYFGVSGGVPARSVLRFVDASPGCMMLSDQAARSMI